MRESAFIVGIFAAGLVLGYLAGTQREAVPQSPYPVNYDPSRAIAADALKLQQQQTETCWKATIEFLKKRDP